MEKEEAKIKLIGNSSDYLCYKVTIDEKLSAEGGQLPKSPFNMDINFCPIKDPDTGEKYLLIHKDAVEEVFEMGFFSCEKYSEEPISEEDKNNLLLRNYLATQRDLGKLARDIHKEMYDHLII